MKIKKVLKIIGIIILIILILVILLLIHTIRNFIIVQKLQNNIAQYLNSTNYHIKSFTKETSGIEMTANFYRRDNKHASLVERNKDGEITKISIYGENDKKGFNTYIENDKSKVAIIDAQGVYLIINMYNGVESDSTWHTFISSMFAIITSAKVNDKDCYVVSNFPSYVNLTSIGKNEYYIEKDTGLMIKNVTNEQIAIREYEFNNVDDSIFIEPDITQYTVREN